jgi:hypothetical protein
MSCITKLLEMKGDNEILPIHDECVIEGGGTYKGYEYLITFTSHGTRCGYVALKPEETERFENERNNEQYYYPDLYCHGGLTFYGNEHGAKDLLTIPCNDTWIGFDCAHAGDGYDKELTKRYFGKQTFSDDFYETFAGFALNGEVVHRSYQYVEQDCHSLIDQLIEQAA